MYLNIRTVHRDLIRRLLQCRVTTQNHNSTGERYGMGVRRPRENGLCGKRSSGTSPGGAPDAGIEMWRYVNCAMAMARATNANSRLIIKIDMKLIIKEIAMTVKH